MNENRVLKFLKSFGNFLLDLVLRVVFVFRDLGIAIWHGILSIIKKTKKFHCRFVDGGRWTKISHFVMGVGNFAHKQFAKGAIFLIIQLAFLAFMIVSPRVNDTPLGAESIVSFFTLGSEKGMPVSDLKEDILESLEEVVPFGGDLTSTNYTAELGQIVRGYSLTEAMKANNVNVVKNENTGKAPEGKTDGKAYEKGTYKYTITDKRYGTNDYYGYQEYSVEDGVKVKGSGSFVVLLSSSRIVDFTDWMNFTSDAPGASCSVGVFHRADAENEHLYFIIVSISGSLRMDTNIISFKNENGNFDYVTNVCRIGYETANVNADVDNSFLMMLFGLITFVLTGLYLIAWNLNIASSYRAESDVKNGEKPTTFIEDCKTLLDGRFHITLLTPAIIFLVIFTIIPTILMILIAFTDMNTNATISGSVLINWVGMQNFVDLFSGGVANEIAKEVGKNFIPVLTWTLEWAVIATFSCYFGGIFLALLINRKDVKLKKLWRTVFVLTIAVPQFITLLIMRNLLTESGPINSMLQSIGIIDGPIDFLQLSSAANGSDPKSVWTARITVLVINLYVGIPHTMLMTSGILMNIPSDLYEAATIDGANKWQMFRKITLPYVIFVTTPYLISSFIGNITSFNIIFLLTGGGPVELGSGDIAGKTDLLVTWLYKMTIDNYKYNAGSIIGILTFLITAFISLVCYRNSKAYKEEDTFQ